MKPTVAVLEDRMKVNASFKRLKKPRRGEASGSSMISLSVADMLWLLVIGYLKFIICPERTLRLIRFIRLAVANSRIKKRVDDIGHQLSADSQQDQYHRPGFQSVNVFEHGRIQ